MNEYIKLNNNDNHLSLGNLFNIIKKIAINKNATVQTEIFCILFDIDNISETTVNNYCTGYRAIGSEYKQKYLNYQKKYFKDKSIMINIINNLISLIDGYVEEYKTIKDLNNNKTLSNLCHSIHPLVKNDLYVPSTLKKELLNYLNIGEYYEFICLTLFFIILEKKQPIYAKDLVNETIEEILSSTNISINDLKKYLTIGFKEGISYIPSLKKLAKENNPYAQHELGNLEYRGSICGYPRYDIAYSYYEKAASFNYPTAYWMLAHMILKEKIGIRSKESIKLAWDYLEKALAMGSISAMNTIGLCYLYGWTKNNKKDENKALEYFEKAAKKNYIYAYNNLGKIYEEKKDFKKAFEYYEKSALEEESWACNKLGLFYYYGIYVKKDFNKALEYFNIGANAEISSRISWNIYNLVNLFYLPGNSIINIKKDLTKCLNLLEQIKNFEPANELFLYCYYELYLETKKNDYLEKVKYYLNLNNNLNNKKKKEIEKKLNIIYNHKIAIKL